MYVEKPGPDRFVKLLPGDAQRRVLAQQLLLVRERELPEPLAQLEVELRLDCVTDPADLLSRRLYPQELVRSRHKLRPDEPHRLPGPLRPPAAAVVVQPELAYELPVDSRLRERLVDLDRQPLLAQPRPLYMHKFLRREAEPEPLPRPHLRQKQLRLLERPPLERVLNSWLLQVARPEPPLLGRQGLEWVLLPGLWHCQRPPGLEEEPVVLVRLTGPVGSVLKALGAQLQQRHRPIVPPVVDPQQPP